MVGRGYDGPEESLWVCFSELHNSCIHFVYGMLVFTGVCLLRE